MIQMVLICGGQSPEHEISIRSARNVLRAIDQSKYKVRVIGITKGGKWLSITEEQLAAVVEDKGEEVQIIPGSNDCFHTENGSMGPVDVVFPILHGPNGEDGAIQGLLQLLGLPFVGPNLLSSAISMDKDVAKHLLHQQGLKVADWLLIRKEDAIPKFEEAAAKLGNTVFIKPANMGSSVGVTKATNEAEWQKGVAEALKFDKKVLVERAILGREVECAVQGNEKPKASGIGEIKASHFYTYDEKYSDESQTDLIIPADVTHDELTNLKTTAVRAYQALECEGLSRVDMFLTPSSEIYINEINTMPGFTSISMYPSLWKQEGVSYSELIDQLIQYAIERTKS